MIRSRIPARAAAAVAAAAGCLALSALLSVDARAQSVDTLAKGFAAPPATAKPQTWWHWLNGNVTREGITADLESMKRLGLGGAEIFTVEEGIPHGPVAFGGPDWLGMVKFANAVAERLGLDLCVHNCAGWSSSGGPWITPEHAMQMVVTSEKTVAGPARFDDMLSQPTTHNGFYRDIAVLAFPTPPADAPKIDNLHAKAEFARTENLPPAANASTDPAGAIASGSLVELTAHLTPDGHLTWDVPAGNWTILRVGYTPTGVTNHPAPPEGRGLEVDKLSKEALDAHFAGLDAKILADLGPAAAGKKHALNDILIDSYEVGSQNWTPRFREEFRARRGYDLLPFLPVFAGHVVQSPDATERFLWDLRRTISDLFDENYYGHFAELCHQHGMIFSTEGYGNGPFEDITAGGAADIPMGEFWTGGGAMETTRIAASSGHIYGRPVVGAESFTASPEHGKWTNDPYSLKALGDRAYANGINRFIFHRFAHQPWLNRYPGMTMGQWGTHFDRTNTWWDTPGARGWVGYLTRAQYLLQQGRFAADVAYFTGENAPVSLGRPAGLPMGYDYDGIDRVSLLKMTVAKNGDVTLPDGMRYRVLVLSSSRTMTPEAARKIRDLVRAGATVVGEKPLRSPSLQDFPRADNEVAGIAAEVWGDAAAAAATPHRYGKGRVFSGTALPDVLHALNLAPDFTAGSGPAVPRMAYLHRTLNGGGEAYFVSNQRNGAVETNCTFRVPASAGLVPEIWNAETGRIARAPLYKATPQTVTLPLRFEPAQSLFVVFRPERKGERAGDAHFVSAAWTPRAGAASPGEVQHTLVVTKALYEAVDGSGAADVTEKVAALVQPDGTLSVEASNDLFGDPMRDHVKQLRVEYVRDGKPGEEIVAENKTLDLPEGGAGGGVERPPAFTLTESAPASAKGGGETLLAFRPGTYTLQTSFGGHPVVFGVAGPLTPVPVNGPWNVAFPPNWGAPPQVTLDRLISWTDHPEAGVRYFSGTATYSRSLDIPPALLGPGRALFLDLGVVRNVAHVTLNGKDLGGLWKPPFRVDITNAAHPGANRLVVEVTNLWPNRLIGDEQLPPDVEWVGKRLKEWPQWLLEGKPSPTGRVTFTTWHHYDKNSPLLPSGLLGPVTLYPAAAKRVP